MKKHIAFMISCIMFAVCFCYPAFAVTAPGRTITTSYDYGDVSLNVSINATGTDTQVTGNSYYQHRFTVTLTNKTNTFQVADTNMIGLKLYSGSDYTFDSQYNNPDGTFYTLGSWTSEVTSYSDNMTVPNVQFYNSNSENFKGCIYISFKDAELLVLNPNETRTYDFTIDFICDLSVNAVPLNGNVNYSYFTYSGNVSIYNKPTAFTSNTVEDFLNNDSFPNSIIYWLMAAYDQGIVDQQKYDDIIRLLTYDDRIIEYYSNHTIVQFGSPSNVYYGSPIITDVSARCYYPYLVSSDVDFYHVDDTSYIADQDRIICLPVYLVLRYDNQREYNYTFNNNFTLNYSTDFNINGSSKFIGYNYDVLFNENVAFRYISNSSIGYSLMDIVNNNMPSGYYAYALIRLNYYFYANNYGSDISDYSINTNNGVPFILSNYNNPTFTQNNNSIFYNIGRSLYELRIRLQQLIDGDTSANQDISDESGTVADTQDTIHAQEQQWYSDNEAAIEATGLSNFEFSSGELDGLTQLRLQFAQVWGALGDWTLVYIFVLSLSLATFILRHRPTTKAQQRMADSAKYRQEVRNRWAAQDARASNNSNGFSDEIWRRAGYL